MSTSRFVSALVLSVVACSTACTASSEDEVLDPSAVLVDRSSQKLTAETLEWISGTYGTGCKDPTSGLAHEATDGWSLRVSGSTPMTNGALKVTKGDGDCVLTLREIGTTDAVFGASPSFALTGSYQGSASAFAIGNGALAFYANAKLSATDMAANFTVYLAFSDDLSAVSGGEKTGSYASFSGSSDAGIIAAPSYTAENTIVIAANDDDKVSSTSGAFTLTVGAQAGETYRIIDSEIETPTFAEVDAAYNAELGGAVAAAISGSPLELTSAQLLADGVQLPAKRTVIIRRDENGVPSYQIFSLSFAAPASM